MRNRLLVALLAPTLLFAQATTTSSSQKCTVSGRVTSAADGTPLSKATLHLAPNFRGSQSVERYLAVSNADGSFQFLNLDPGSYRLSAERTGFIHTIYGSARQGQPGTLITAAPGQQLMDLKMALTPQAVITGRLIDEDGDPTSADGIEVLHQTWMGGKLTYRMRSAREVDDRGSFRASDLAAGKYIVCAQMEPQRSNEIPSGGKPPVAPVTTCYPSATSIADATPIDIQSGQELDGIEIRVRSMRTFHVRGKITGMLPAGTDRERMELTVTPEDTGFTFFGGGESIAKNGSFDIANVGPGSYQLTLFDDSEVQLAALSVAVSSADVNGIVLNVVPPGQLHGTVRIEGTPSSGSDQWTPDRVNVSLSSENRNGRFEPPAQDSAKADGTLTIEDVAAAKYRVNVSGTPSGGYLAALRFNNQDLPGKLIDLSQGASGELEIVFRYGAAEIDGTIEAPQNSTNETGTAGSAPPSASVALVPDNESTALDGTKFASTDQNGGFNFKGVAPGQYHVFALEQAAPGSLQNPAVVKAISGKGVEVEVKENDRKQVQVSVISEAEFRQVLSGLGIDEE
jgi:hypothetical protein